MRLTSTWTQGVVAITLATSMASHEMTRIRADELVDLKLDSKPRRFAPQNPLQAEKQDCSISKPRVLTLVHVIDPVHKDAGGGFTLDEVNLRNYVIGTGLFQERIPDTAIPGQRRGPGAPGTTAKLVSPTSESPKDTKPEKPNFTPLPPDKPAEPDGPAVKESAHVAPMTVQAGTRSVKTGDTVSVPLWLIHEQGLDNLNRNLTSYATVAQAAGGGLLAILAVLFAARKKTAAKV